MLTLSQTKNKKKKTKQTNKQTNKQKNKKISDFHTQEFAGDNFKFDENGMKFFKPEENTVG